MGGMLGNAIGGGAGDALSGLFGGGDLLGGSSSGVQLEGDVNIGTDVKFNTLIITGATSMDLDTISELIDYVDAPEPPPMDLLGKTFYIPVIHRDPTELLDRAKTQFSDLIKKEEASGGGNAEQMKQAQQMMKAMQQLTGGGKRGGGDAEQEKPVATIGVDESTSMILVTGPEFIYLKVLDLVEKLDVPDTSSEKRKMITTENQNAEVIAKTLAAMLGEKGELVIGGETVTPGTSSAKTSSSSSSGRSSGDAAKAAASQQEAVRNAFMKAMQQRASGGGSSGGSSRGGSSRGGSSRGGSGRGGR